MLLLEVQKEIRALADPAKAKNSTWFFKTGPGQYGEGDKFLGLSTPQMQLISKKYKNLSLTEIDKLIASVYHEERSVAVQILVSQYPNNSKEIFNFYLSHTQFINNWDLVDISAPKIVGDYLYNFENQDISLLKKLAVSSSLWERRIAIISTLAFLYQCKSSPTFQISEILLKDKHDLIHKAVGWMLRESAKRVSQEDVENFLQKHYSQLPRTTLRYAIERFSGPKRKQYLIGKFS